MKTTTLYDEVISLIENANSIDSDTRLSMIQEIQTEGISPEMQERIMSLFRSESGDLGAAIAQAQGVIEKTIQLKGESDAATLPDSQAVEAAFSGAVTTVANELETVCAREAKTIDTAVGTALEQRDSDAADAVRQSLKI